MSTVRLTTTRFVLSVFLALMALALPRTASAFNPSVGGSHARSITVTQNPNLIDVPGVAGQEKQRVGSGDLVNAVHDALLVSRGTTGAESALQAERLRASLSAQELATAPRVGSGLKADPLHRAGSFVVDDVAQSGRVFPLRGGDGVQRSLTQVEGAVNGQAGIFEWIVDPSGAVTHQRFIPGGRITGFPNQVP